MRDVLSLTEGQPLAGQIRSRRICPSLAAFLKLELFRVHSYVLRQRFAHSVTEDAQPRHREIWQGCERGERRTLRRCLSTD
ncbi:hypothetical protein F9W95_11795 [Pectobacterium carotovorum]|nr:hypothetical protein [Pectobacterium carotovorum subsp. carotovorum]MCL6341351.1 hypothetical protein [Pectobacterium carotovorum subsp. carotovorum]MCL6386071.1 hypothetical protein [Pectobacterium carotovorum subsp. carotovorum]ULS46226.1 hypothetical protein F9W95_11795 [Pectobacterium carotovorum]